MALDKYKVSDEAITTESDPASFDSKKEQNVGLDKYMVGNVREEPRPIDPAINEPAPEYKEPEEQPGKSRVHLNAKGTPAVTTENLDDGPKPEGVLRNLPSAFQQVMTEDTYVGQQALATTTQALDFFPSMLGGLRANVKNVLEKTFGEKIASGIRKAARFTPGAAIVGESEELDNLLDESGKLRKESADWLMDSAIEQAGNVGAVSVRAIDVTQQTLMTLATFKAAGIKYGVAPEKATRTARAVATLKNALLRSTLMTATTEQESIGRAAASFGISTLYQSTPAVSGWINNNAGAIATDIALNTSITAFQVNGIREIARQQALADGHPERGGLYEVMALVEAFGKDVIYGSFTRSFNKTQAPPEVREAVDDAFSKSQEIVSAFKEPPKRFTGQLRRFVRGEGTTQNFQQWINANFAGNWRVVPYDPSRESIPDGALDIPFGFRASEGASGPSEMRAYVTESVSGLGREGSMLPSIRQRPFEVEQRAQSELRDAQREELRTLLSEAAGEVRKVPHIEINDQSPQIIRDISKRVNGVVEAVSRSSVGSEGEFAEGVTRKAQQILGRISKDLDLENAQDSTGQRSPVLRDDLFGDIVDRAAQKYAPVKGPDDIRRILNRSGMSEELNDYAKALGKETVTENGRDVTRRQLNEQELMDFAQQRDISIPTLEDQGMAADMVKASHMADTPEQAVRIFDQLRIAKGFEPLVRLSDAARGGQPSEPERYYLSTEEKERLISSMPSALQDPSNPIGREAMLRVVHQVDHPLPKNPQEFNDVVKLYRKIAIRTARGMERSPNGMFKAKSSMWNKAQVWENARYAFGDLATMTGNLRIYDDYRKVDLSARRATHETEKLTEEIFKSAGLTKRGILGGVRPDFKIRYYISGRPELSNAIKVLLGTNPDAKPNTVEGKRRAEALKVIDKIEDAEVKESITKKGGLLDSIENNQLQGTDALNIRRLQLYKFIKQWETLQQDGRTFGEKYLALRDLGKNRNKTQEEEFVRISDTLKNYLPHKNVDGKGRQVDVEEMIKLTRLYREGGDDAVVPELVSQDGWIRKNYYMTKGEIEEMGLRAVEKERISTAKGSDEASVKEIGAVNSRTGFGSETEGDVFASLYRHSLMARLQADTFWEANRLKDALKTANDKGIVPKETYSHANRWLENAWGKYTAGNFIMRNVGRPVEGAFWTTYALAKWPWYAGRNVLYQGAAYGPLNTHFRVGDVQKAYWSTMKDLRNPNSRTAKWYQKRFQSDISNMRAIFYEQMMEADPGSIDPMRSVSRMRLQHVWNFASRLIGAPDEFNRRIGAAAYKIADMHVERFVDGKSSKSQVFSALKIPTMHILQQRAYHRLFENARTTPVDSVEWDLFREAIARDKINNINFDYNIRGRSLLEQDPSNRPWLGVRTYMAGTWNELVQNGFRPIWSLREELKAGTPISDADWQSARQGAGVIAKSIFTHAIASAVGGFIMGEKADFNDYLPTEDGDEQTAPNYSLVHTLFGWNGIRPGFNFAIEFIQNGVGLVGLMAGGNYEDAQKNIDKYADRLVMFSGILPWIERILDAQGDVEGVKIVRLLDEHYRSEKWSDKVERNAWEKFVQKPFFGTAIEHDERYDLDAWEQIYTRALDGDPLIGKRIKRLLQPEQEKKPQQPQ